MKKLTWLVVLVGVMSIAACGGSGSSGGGTSQAAKDAATLSADAFGGRDSDPVPRLVHRSHP